MKWLSNLSISRSVTTIMLIITMIALGLVSLVGLPVELMPNLNFPVITIATGYSGVAPQDMEELVTKPIENAIESIEGVKTMTSYSREGMSYVVVQFEWGTNLDPKSIDIKDKINIIKGRLPSDIDDPIVSKMNIMSNEVAMKLNLSGGNLLDLKKLADDVLKPKFERIPGVGSVDVYGGLDKEILIKVDPYKLESYGLTVDSLVNLLKTASINMPAGNIKEGGKEFLVRILGKAESVNDIKNIVISNKNGNTLYLKDIVKIMLGTEDRVNYNRFDGKESISLNLIKESGGNTVSIADNAKKMMKNLKNELPEGVKLTIGQDKSTYIKDSMNMVRDSALTALVLAAIVLFMFLKNVRATLIISTAIPTSIIFTFVLIKYKGISMNLLSLGGLALGVGMLVDNSVIVLENIYRHLTEYKKPVIEAARDGAAEMGLPILASTATTVAVFLPIAFANGIAGEIFRDFSYTVAFSLLASMIVALTFVPMISSKVLKEGRETNKEGKFFVRLKEKYSDLISMALSNRWKTLGMAVFIFVIVIVIGAMNVGLDFFPSTDSGEYTVTATLPTGFNLEKANKIGKKIEKIVKENKYTKKYITQITKKTITIDVETPSKDVRKEGIEEISSDIRGKMKNIPDITYTVKGSSRGGGGGGAAIQVLVQGDNYAILEKLSNEVKEKIKNLKGVVDVKSSFEGGNPEVRIKINREKAAYYGLNISYISSIINSKMAGIVPLKIQSDGQDIKVKLILKEKYRDSIKKLEDILISTPKGGTVRLKEVANFEQGEGPTQILREDKRREIIISANNSEISLGNATKEVTKAISGIKFPSGYSYKFGGSQKDMMEAMQSLVVAFLIAVFLVYMILASQFESFILPLIIMISVPFSLVGVYLGLIITGFSLSITVMIGVIMLAGIVVNNAIVLIDYINLLKAREIERHKAIKKAGETRLRPILMTTTTTVVGMIPLAMGIGASSDFYQPLAISVIFGLSVSTLLTLVVIPVLYSLFDDFHIWYMKKRGKTE